MSDSIYHGGIPGSTEPAGAYVHSFVIEDMDRADLSPEMVCLSRYSETDGKAYYHLVSIQTGPSIVGLMEALQGIVCCLREQIGRNILEEPLED